MKLGIITLDGPAASGKSTVARLVAERLGLPYVSSGLLYRVATHLVLRRGRDPEDAAGVLGCLAEHEVRLVPGSGGNAVFVDATEVTDRLHSDAVDAAVSTVARHERLRSWVTARLREIPAPFVVEGRDMGSVVFPEARHKFYLTAPADERARRRVGERAAELGQVAAAIRRRDALDARQLEPAADARHIDTGGLSPEQVVAVVLEAVARVGTQ